MKLRGYRPHAVADGVEVWECVPFEVPIKRVLDLQLVSAEGRPWVLHDGVANADIEPTTPECHGPVGYRRADGEECRFAEGLVVGTGFMGFVEFLVTRYVALADGPFEHLCCRAAAEKLTADAFRREVERLVNEFHSGWPGQPRRFRHRRSWSGSPILFFQGNDHLPGVRLETPTGQGVFLTTEHLVLSRDFEADCRGLSVPRRSWALVSKFPTEPVLCWDGERASCITRSHLARSGILGPMDRDGTALSDLPSPCVGAPELEPLFLLRVPPKAELEAVAERAPDEPILQTAAFLFDSRCAVPLPSADSAVPVVVDPAVARYVLARTTPFGAYVPTAPPSAILPAALPGTVQIGALPRLP